MKQNLVTGYCPDTVGVSKNIRASILHIKVDRGREKKMGPANCSCKMSMYYSSCKQCCTIDLLILWFCALM